MTLCIKLNIFYSFSVDFGASSNAEKKNQVDDSWANWENDAWESLSKKD